MRESYDLKGNVSSMDIALDLINLEVCFYVLWFLYSLTSNIYILHIVLSICILPVFWSLILLGIHAYHMVQCIYYYRSQPKQVLLEVVELVDMEKELELEKELVLVLERKSWKRLKGSSSVSFVGSLIVWTFYGYCFVQLSISLFDGVNGQK